MTREDFMATYAATFCATMAANSYQDDCFVGRYPYCSVGGVPMEDALHLAGYAWEAYLKNRNDITLQPVMFMEADKS